MTMRVAVLGASGLIGAATARHLRAAGLDTLAVARRLTPALRAEFGADALEAPIVAMAPAALAEMFASQSVGVVVNCVGALQTSGAGDPDDVHSGFVARLIEALGDRALVQISMPGEAEGDATDFSRSKRRADAAIVARLARHVILRPGFVIAPTPYGASALLRALAQTPFDLPEAMRARPFATTAIADLCEAIEHVARRSLAGESFRSVWDVASGEATTLGDVVDAFRRRFGAPPARWRLPMWSARLAALAADAAASLGWLSPMRSTALVEIGRGVVADPTVWTAAAKARPRRLDEAVAAVPADAPARWFARLYLVKPAVIAALALFWIASGVIALGPGFSAARDFLAAHGAGAAAAGAFVAVTALADVAVGAMIAARPTHRAGLAAGAALASAYLVGASLIAPELWSDPLGPLVKVAPALALSLVAWAIFPDR